MSINRLTVALTLFCSIQGLNGQLFEDPQMQPVLVGEDATPVLYAKTGVRVTYTPYNEFIDNAHYSIGQELEFAEASGRFLKHSAAVVGFEEGAQINQECPTYVEPSFPNKASLSLKAYTWSMIQPANQIRTALIRDFFPGKQEVLIGFAVNVGGGDQYGWVRMRRPVIDTVTIFTPVEHALHPVPGLPIRAGKAPELPSLVTEYDAGSGNLKLNWPVGLAGVRLQEADSLKTPMVWRDVEGGPDGEYEVPLPSEGQVFFRLQHGP
jgi:hypothetical protein